MIRERQNGATESVDFARLLADAAAIVAVTAGDNIAAARAGLLVWMDAEEAAAYLGEEPSRFRRYAARGEFDRYKDIGGYKYSRDDLDAWRRDRMPAR